MTLNRRTAALLSVPPLLWAGNAVVGRLVVATEPPLLLNLLRWSLALLLVLPLGWRVLGSAQARSALWQRRGPLALLGLFGVAAYNAFQYMALTTTTALNATLIAASGPVWMLAVGALFYGERVRPAQWLGAALSIAGVLVVLGRGDLGLIARLHLVIGDLLMLCGVACWTVYSWLLARPPASMREGQRPPWTWAEFLVLQFLFGVPMSGLAALAGHWAAPQALHWSPGLAAALLFVAVGPSIIAFRCWGMGVAAAGPAVAAFFANLTPLFAALLSSTLLGEPPHLYHVLAFGLIVAGIVVSSRGR